LPEKTLPAGDNVPNTFLHVRRKLLPLDLLGKALKREGGREGGREGENK
jgi:hypothetical protein